MDFFERFFHFSPDGGSGATEAVYIITISAIALVVAFRHSISRFIERRKRAEATKSK